MKWHFEKFKGDMAIYAICPKCKFIYNASELDKNLNPVITGQYKYCPMCGKYLYAKGKHIELKRYNERSIVELYNGEYKNI